MKLIHSLIGLSLVTVSAMAIEPMQKEAGWSGFALLGAGHLNYKNNEVAGSDEIDVKNKRIDNRGSGSSKSTVIPAITGVVRYTFESKKTEVFIGNTLEDYLRLDTSMSLGIRHEYKQVGILGMRLLATTMPTSVWTDPLATGVDRQETDRSSLGMAFKWERIMNSNFEVDFRHRNIKFDTDNNGASLVNNGLAGTSAGSNGEVYITSAQQELLKREGTEDSLELLYTWIINQTNFLVPSMKYTVSNRDGESRDYNEAEFKVSYAHISSKWTVASSIFAGSSFYESNNPVFTKKQDASYIGVGINATYKKPFGWKDWGINANLYSSKSDSDIDFYDSELFIATLGMVYSF